MSGRFVNLLIIKAPNSARLAEVVAGVTDEHGFFTLNSILPIPVDYYGSQPNDSAVMQAKREISKETGVVFDDAHCHDRPVSEDELEDVKRAKALFKEHGACCQADWCVQNWGCLCDSDDSDGLMDNVFRFITRGGTAIKAIEAVAKQFPDVEFRAKWQHAK